MHQVLIKRLVNPAKERVWLGETDCFDMTIAVGSLGHKTSNQIKKNQTMQIIVKKNSALLYLFSPVTL